MYRKFGKRLLDIGTSSVALIVLSPILAVAAAAVKLYDGGPVLFVQHRVGRDGEEFRFLKFRSMPVESPQIPSGGAATLTTTPIGRIIRRTSIDELPQLFNIVRGDMSVVGPRPSLPSQTSLVDLRRKSGALALRPGLTGLAQINSYDGMPIEEKAAWDAEYAEGLTLRSDLAIVARTFLYLLKPPPRY